MQVQWKERLKRLTSMGRSELLDRMRQQVGARSDVLRYRWGVGFEVALRPSGMTPRFFFSPDDVPRLLAHLQERLPQQVEEILKRAEKICRHRFDLLGYEDLDYGDRIDWHCDRVHGRRAPRKPWFAIRYLDFGEAGDVKITWELNRHQHLVTLAKAYRLSHDEHFAAELFRQWRHWHLENPYPIGVNWASSLEVGIRSLSWIWVYFLLAGSPVMPTGFREEWRKSLGISGRYLARNLSTYFSPNTHLLGEAVALFFIGTLCPELAPAERWQRLGWDLILREAQRQVHGDGFHFEGSLYYHVYALDFFIHAAVLAAANDLSIPAGFDRVIERMLSVLCLLGRAGAPPQMGDDDGGRVFDPRRNRAAHMLDPLATGAVLYGRGDFKTIACGPREETLWLLGTQGVAEFDRLPDMPPDSSSTALQSSGLYLIANPAAHEQIVVNAGPQGRLPAGHRHADALSVCWHRDGKALLIDPGACEYVGSGPERGQFRGTSAHNALLVDGMHQADAKGPFAWSNFPKAKAEGWTNGQTFDLFVGSHDGYRRVPGPALHRRWVFSLKSHFWLVRDVVLGQGKRRLDLFWHMSPELSSQEGTERFADPCRHCGLRLIEVEDNGWEREVHQEWWSPAYGVKKPAPVLHFSTLTELPAEFVSLLHAVEGTSAPAGRLTRVRESPENLAGYSYRTETEEHRMFFAKPGSVWSIGVWSGDAEFLYWGGTHGKRVLICCNATHVEAGGKAVLQSLKPVLRCEILTTGQQVQVVSSDPAATVDGAAVLTAGVELEPAPTRTGG